MESNSDDQSRNRVPFHGASREGVNRSVDDRSMKLHAGKCSVCGHAQREDIDRVILAWRSPKEIVKEYRLGGRRAVYRHSRALGLLRQRYANIRAVLARIMERASEAPVTAWAVVAAVQACAKINARGQWVDKDESSAMQAELDAMSLEELMEYARSGCLPEWAPGADQMPKQVRVVIEEIGSRDKSHTIKEIPVHKP